MRRLLRMEHYHVLVANVIFTCGFAAQRSTFALLLMSLLSHLGSPNPHNLPQNIQEASRSQQLVDVLLAVSSDPWFRSSPF